MVQVEVREYLDSAGGSPFGNWFAGLNAVAAAKITVAVSRLEAGNFSNVKGVGAGVFEYRIDFGPGYRIYFGKDGPRVLILVGGSSKKGQAEAIAAAQAQRLKYKRAKAKEKQ